MKTKPRYKLHLGKGRIVPSNVEVEVIYKSGHSYKGVASAWVGWCWAIVPNPKYHIWAYRVLEDRGCL